MSSLLFCIIASKFRLPFSTVDLQDCIIGLKTKSHTFYRSFECHSLGANLGVK